MTRSTGAALVLGVAVWFGMASSAWATLDNFKTFKETYKDAKAPSCKTCHLGPVGKKDEYNAYGAALQQLKGAGHAAKLTADDLKAVEAGDADQDGVSNGDEIKAGTNPGDPASK